VIRDHNDTSLKFQFGSECGLNINAHVWEEYKNSDEGSEHQFLHPLDVAPVGIHRAPARGTPTALFHLFHCCNISI
jgi:hypothetical protein